VRQWDRLGTWRRIDEDHGWYTVADTVPHPDSGEPVRIAGTESHSVVVMAPFLRAFCILHELSGEAWYRDRAADCLRAFRERWRVENGCVQWDHQPLFGHWDYDAEGKPSRYEFVHPNGAFRLPVLRALVDAYAAGIVIDKADMRLLVHTNVECMWNGDRDEPAFTLMDGRYEPDGRHGHGVLWTPLARFDATIRDLWRPRIVGADVTLFGRALSVLDYLLQTAEPTGFRRRALP